MQCPNCQAAFHDRDDDWEVITENDPERGKFNWMCELTICPRCREPIIVLSARQSYVSAPEGRLVIYPNKKRNIVVASEVPERHAADFVEASSVLEVSPKASAALSRRVLQSILTDQGYVARDLARQVEAVLSETEPQKMLPNYIGNKVDVIRNFGNFSAHPVTDLTTSQIIDVEPKEAEWCLEIVSDLFEHYYIRPASEAKKLAELNEKLKQAGKPPVK